MTTVSFKASVLAASRGLHRIAQFACFLVLLSQAQPTRAGPDDLESRNEAVARTSHVAEAQGLDRDAHRQRFATTLFDRPMTSGRSGGVDEQFPAASGRVTGLAPGRGTSGRCGEGTLPLALDLVRDNTGGVDVRWADIEDLIFADGFDGLPICTPPPLDQVCGTAGAPPLCGVANNTCGGFVNCGAGFCQAVGGLCNAGMCECPSNAYLCQIRPYCNGLVLRNPCSGELLNCNGCPPGGSL